MDKTKAREEIEELDCELEDLRTIYEEAEREYSSAKSVLERKMNEFSSMFGHEWDEE